MRDPDAAHDALQEALLRAYRAIDRFGGDELLGAWLHRILDNVCNDEVVRRQREILLLQRVGVPRDEHIDARLTFDASVECALDSLPATYRETLVLRAVDDLSFQEVGNRTGVTEENARARFHRARTMFRRVFDAPSAVLLPVVGVVSGWVRRVSDASSSSAGATLGPASSSPAVGSVWVSPVTTHLLAEVSSVPERVSILAKVLITVAAAVPVAAAAQSSAPRTPLAPEVVEVAGATTTSSVVPLVEATSVPPSVMSTASTTTTTIAPAHARSTLPPVKPAPTEADSSAAPPPADAPPPASMPPALVKATVEVASDDAGRTRLQGDASLMIGDQRVDGQLICNIHPGDGARSLWCNFTGADKTIAVAGGGLFSSDGQAPGGRVDGTYDVISGGDAPSGLAPSGRLQAQIDSDGDGSRVQVQLVLAGG